MVIAAGEGGAEGSPGEDGVACVAIDIAGDGAAEVATVAGQQQEHGGACRICQLGDDGALPERVSGRLVRLGCDCRGDLAVAHRRCAEAWFTIRGDRCCEICGKNTENVHGGIGAQKFMLQWHDTPSVDGGGSSGCGCSKTQSCCHLLIGCFMIMLILPWLRHDHIL